MTVIHLQNKWTLILFFVSITLLLEIFCSDDNDFRGRFSIEFCTMVP